MPGFAQDFIIIVKIYCSVTTLVQLLAKIGVGVHYDDKKQLGYTLRGKKSFPLTSNGLVGVNIKGLLLTDQEYDVVSFFPPSIFFLKEVGIPTDFYSTENQYTVFEPGTTLWYQNTDTSKETRT